VTLAFLTPGGGVPAESPILQRLAAIGAAVELRDGWRVAARVSNAAAEEAAIAQSVAWADYSHLVKLEVSSGALHGSRGRAEAMADALWCWLTPDRRLVLRDRAGRTPAGAVDVTTQLGGILLAGPLAQAVIARFCALDLRSDRATAGSFLPGSVARTPGYALVLDSDRYLLFYGAAYSEYMWQVVSDAGEHAGGRPVGVDAIGAIVPPARRRAHA
jgi:glycine cleavage system aminomethyltransferase T